VKCAVASLKMVVEPEGNGLRRTLFEHLALGIGEIGSVEFACGVVEVCR
jgi:hypothetical protein